MAILPDLTCGMPFMSRAAREACYANQLATREAKNENKADKRDHRTVDRAGRRANARQRQAARLAAGEPSSGQVAADAIIAFHGQSNQSAERFWGVDEGQTGGGALGGLFGGESGGNGGFVGDGLAGGPPGTGQSATGIDPTVVAIGGIALGAVFAIGAAIVAASQ